MLTDTPLYVETTGSQSSGRPNSNPSNPSSSQGQASASQPDHFSQTPAVPPFPRDGTTINSLLIDSTPGPSKALTTVSSEVLLDPTYTYELVDDIVSRTSGYGVEQLEQVYSAMMSEIWRTRGSWDRGEVARHVASVFEDVMDDIKMCQGVANGSMELTEYVD